MVKFSVQVRKGLPYTGQYGLEDLFHEYGVDIEIWAHEHLYERMYPLYDYVVYNGSTAAPYTEPTAPIHIITGSAGCPEGLDPFVDDPAYWSAKRISDYGYTKMIVHNATHLSMEQISAVQEGKVVDQFTIKKSTHGAYPKPTKGYRHYNKEKHNENLFKMDIEHLLKRKKSPKHP